jgi:hypothetical protein
MALTVADGGIEVVVGQGWVQDFVADDTGQVLAELNRLDVLGARAFWPPAFGVRHLLAFSQVVKTDTFEARRVEKQVFVASRVDEPEAPVRQPFDRSLCHLCIPCKD